jgi:hypothetical protein
MVPGGRMGKNRGPEAEELERLRNKKASVVQVGYKGRVAENEDTKGQ